jgi:hypothetical protein
METKQCLTCKLEKNLFDFPAQKKQNGVLYYRPHCYSCKYGKEIIAGRVADKNYHREYYYSNMLDIKYKAYRHRDNSKYKSESLISRDEAVKIMMKSCHYCQKEKSSGIDRKDSNLGYTQENLVTCCEKCNNLLSDIPYLAKVELINGLTSINKKGLLDKWTIATKRKS